MNKMLPSIAVLLCFVSCNAPTAPRPASVPVKLNVPAGHHLAYELGASGVQIYICQAKADDPTQYEWVFKAPDARLTDSSGEVGKHYGGPTWEAVDGSKVVGKKEQQVEASSADDIPWLLLSAKSNAGQGRFSKVTFIQRIMTHGGKAPNGGCDAQHAGQESRVPYTATYRFFVAD